jgi:beta-lactamase regulating signal transducer with metallopeptidase domain
MWSLLDGVATSLFTYAMHSAAACVLALAASRLLRRPQDRDLVWKAAFVAPVFTAATTILLSAFDDRGPFVDLARLVRHTVPLRFPGRQVTVRVLSDGVGQDVVRQFVDPVSTVLSTVAVACALCVASVGFARFIYRRRSLARALQPRQRAGELHDVAHGTPIVLSTAVDLQSPVAFGVAEICLPTAVMTDFTTEHRRSLIAHEVAHLERRDPAWLFFVELITGLSAFQPLLVAVARAFRRDVELICDEAAVRQTNDRSAMIGALARLAAPFDARSPMYGAATAYDGSPLIARATRIATVRIEDNARGTQRRAIGFVLALITLLCAVPVVSAAPRRSDFPRDPVDAMRKARADDRILAVDSSVTVNETGSEFRRRTIVRLQ